jgi:hypothetical protein
VRRDPVEEIVADALTAAGVPFVREDDELNTAALDFYLPDDNLFIEVKQFHSPRIAAQMERAANVIAIQGIAAAQWFAVAITRSRKGD